MPSVSNVVDTLLSLGEEIAEAAEADDWERVSMLVEQRSAVAKQLPTNDHEFSHTDLADVDDETLSALSDQNDRLYALLQELRKQTENELAQINGLREAQKSYMNNSSRSGVLPTELRG